MNGKKAKELRRRARKLSPRGVHYDNAYAQAKKDYKEARRLGVTDWMPLPAYAR